MTNLFTWQFLALVAGVVTYMVTLRYAFSDEGFWFALWAIVWGMILIWIGIDFFPSLTEVSPPVDIALAVILMLVYVVHVTTAICWLATI